MKLFFKNANKKLQQKLKKILRHLHIPKLPKDKSKLYEEDLTAKDLYDYLIYYVTEIAKIKKIGRFFSCNGY